MSSPAAAPRSTPRPATCGSSGSTSSPLRRLRGSGPNNPRPTSTAALLESAFDGDDEQGRDEDDEKSAPSGGVAAHHKKKARRKSGKQKEASESGFENVAYSTAETDSVAGKVDSTRSSYRKTNCKDEKENPSVESEVQNEQQGPKFSDSGGVSSELVLNANTFLESLAWLRAEGGGDQHGSNANILSSSLPESAGTSTATVDNHRQDNCSTDKQESESWRFRRRKPGRSRMDASYHRDYQEALQSLLWEPYDCRDPKDTPMYQYADDADVSLWLYSRPISVGGSKLQSQGNNNNQCPCACRCALHHNGRSSSSSSRSSSTSSLGSEEVVTVEREMSASSLRGLLSTSISAGSGGWEVAPEAAAPPVPASKDVLGKPADAAGDRDLRLSCSSSGVERHRHHRRHHHQPPLQQNRRQHRMVTDLKTPWIGTATLAQQPQTSSLRRPPPTALTASLAVAQDSATAEARLRQSESERAGRRTPSSSCRPGSESESDSASYGQRPTMLVTVSEETVPVARSVTSVTVSGASVNNNSEVWATSPTSAEQVSSVNVVDTYTAVPSPSVATVPTIPCLNNVSNVHILPTAGTTPSPAPTPRPRPRATLTPTPAPGTITPPPSTQQPSPRTFASTEAQTDDLDSDSRRERRRVRRERRHLRRLQPRHPHPAPPPPTSLPVGQTSVPGAVAGEPPAGLPDILHSHLPPPYTTLPLGLPPHLIAAAVPPGVAQPVPLVGAPAPPLSPPPQVPPGHRLGGPGLRFPFAFVPTARARSGRGATYTADEEPKSCCGVLVGQPVSIRWFILLILLVGLCLAIVGTVLGAMKASGREHLTMSLLMIGVGIVLVTVSGVAWRLTSHDAPSCRVMLGMASGDEGTGAGTGTGEPNRRFVPRLPPSYGRPHHPYAAMMYPEFQYRPPPPSYQASMQEYRLRLLLLDRHPGGGHTQTGAVSPPPTYRSHAGSLLRAPLGCRRDVAISELSRPPSYRSRSSSSRPSLEPGGGSGGLAGALGAALGAGLGSLSGGRHSRTGSGATDHTRGGSLSLSDSGTAQPVSVISVGGAGLQLDSIKCAPEQEDFTMSGADPAGSTLQMMLQKGESGSKDANLVTIVQTSAAGSPVSSPGAQDTPIMAPVIVTVSGSTPNPLAVCPDNAEMEILAHL